MPEWRVSHIVPSKKGSVLFCSMATKTGFSIFEKTVGRMSYRIKTLRNRPNVLDQQISELRRDIALKTRPKVHDFEVRRPDVTREERGSAVGHLVNPRLRAQSRAEFVARRTQLR